MAIKLRKRLFVFSFISFVFLSAAVVYAGNPPDAGNSSVTATQVPADGTTASTITVTLKDSSGTVLTGDTVQIANATDSTIKINPTSVTLDSSGVATFSATSTTAGTDSIDVTDTTTTTTLTGLGSVVFTAAVTPTAVPTIASVPTPTPTPQITTPVTGPSDLLFFGLAGLLLSVGGFSLFLKK